MCGNHEKEYINIQTGEKLDWERVDQLPDNAMLKVNPVLWIEWDFEKNDELGFDVWGMTKGLGIATYWTCVKCDNQYQAKVINRTNNSRCSYCANRRINHTNSLTSKNPELTKEWHPTKNGDLTPNDVTCHTSKKVWWLGECGHDWEMTISNRSNGSGCPICSNQKVLKGFNDMWTTNPELAGLLLNKEDGYNYTYGSNKKVDWRCPDCENVIKGKKISSINHQGLFCPECSDGKSYPEKFMYHLLKQLNIEFECEKIFNWSDRRRYDFYIPSHDMIIETHGSQHIGYHGFKTIGGRSLEEEQLNDKYKEEMAMNNGIPKYIHIDCRKSELEWVKASILKSELNDIFDLSCINWSNIELNSNKSLILKVSKFYNDGLRSTLEIGKILKIGQGTVIRYLKKACEAGLCDYDSRKNDSLARMKKRRKIVQLTKDLKYIDMHESANEISKKYGYNEIGIRAVCKGTRKTTYGFKWMYKEDYDKYIEEQGKLA